MSDFSIQAVQARLLLTMFAVFGGNVEEVVTSMEIVGFWARVMTDSYPSIGMYS
jgi:hypothetical protein